MKKVWIFDFDGTIADTRESFYEAFQRACLQLGIESLSPRSFLDVFDGNMFEGLYAYGLEKGREMLFMEHLKHFLAQSKETTTLFPGMGEVLNELGREYPVYVITSNDSSFVRNILEENAIVAVRAVLGGDIDISKVVKIGTLQRQYTDHTLYYVGDTRGDMLEAHRAKVQAVAVGWGWHDSARLQMANPDRIFQNPADILNGENAGRKVQEPG